LRTAPSTLGLVQEKCKKGGKQPMKAYSEIIWENRENGTQSFSNVPRNKKRVYNVNWSRSRNCNSVIGANHLNCVKDDDIFAVIAQISEAAAHGKFVKKFQDEEGSPMSINFTDQHLFDIQRFCTGFRTHFSILSVDMTFNLGEHMKSLVC
jgi:hypothetical protein